MADENLVAVCAECWTLIKNSQLLTKAEADLGPGDEGLSKEPSRARDQR